MNIWGYDNIQGSYDIYDWKSVKEQGFEIGTPSHDSSCT
jgi:hypothetical protein